MSCPKCLIFSNGKIKTSSESVTHLKLYCPAKWVLRRYINLNLEKANKNPSCISLTQRIHLSMFIPKLSASELLLSVKVSVKRKLSLGLTDWCGMPLPVWKSITPAKNDTHPASFIISQVFSPSLLRLVSKHHYIDFYMQIYNSVFISFEIGVSYMYKLILIMPWIIVKIASVSRVAIECNTISLLKLMRFFSSPSPSSFLSRLRAHCGAQYRLWTK